MGFSLDGLGQGLLGALEIANRMKDTEANAELRKAQSGELQNRVELLKMIREGRVPNFYQQNVVPGTTQQPTAIPPSPVSIKPGQQQPAKPEVDDTQPSPYLKGLGGEAWKNLHPDVKKNLNLFSKDFYEKTGRPFTVTDGWRSYETQADLYKRKPHLAAKPGTSRHELGEALDAHTEDAEDAYKHGLFDKYPMFHRPMAVRQPGKKYEPWHIELKRS